MLNAYDRDIVERDSGIRGLALLLQPEVLAAAIAEQMGETVAAPARVTYLRYKPGVNCIARFELGKQLGYAKAFGADAGRKLSKAGLYGEGDRLVLEDPRILVSFFPADSKLRSLSRLADAEQRQTLLARIFKTDPSWRDAGLTTLNYKPERRYVARLLHPDGRAATLKLFGRREFAATRRARKKLQPPPELGMPEWIGGSKIHQAMAYAWLQGEALDKRLAQGQADDARLAGEAIARLHASEQPALGKRQSKNPLEVLDSLCRQLSWLAPDLGGEAQEIGAVLTAWWADRIRHRQPVHGDFYDRQVVVQETGVGIIDTDSAHLGSPLEDLGCFLAHLERRTADGILSGEASERAGRALRNGYLDAIPGADLGSLDPYTAFNLFKLTPHPFRDRSPDWPQQTRRLLHRCRQLLQTHRAS